MKKSLIFLISLFVSSAPLYNMDTPKSWHLVARDCSWFQPTEDHNARYYDFIKEDVDANRSIADELLWAQEMNDKGILVKDITDAIVTFSSKLPYQYSNNLKIRPFYGELLFAHAMSDNNTLPTDLTKEILALRYQLSQQNPNPDLTESFKQFLSNPKTISYTNRGNMETALYLNTDAVCQVNQPMTIEGKDRKFAQGMFNRIQGLPKAAREVLAQKCSKDVFVNTNYQEPSFFNKIWGNSSTARERNAGRLGSAAKLLTKLTLYGTSAAIAQKLISSELIIGLCSGIITAEISPNISISKNYALGAATGGVNFLIKTRAEADKLFPDKTIPITADDVKMLPSIKIAAKTVGSLATGQIITIGSNIVSDYVKDQVIDSFKETDTETLKRRGFRMESLLPEDDTYDDIKRRYEFNYGPLADK